MAEMDRVETFRHAFKRNIKRVPFWKRLRPNFHQLPDYHASRTDNPTGKLINDERHNHAWK